MSTHKNIQRNLLHSDYLISPNQFTYEKLLKSHDTMKFMPEKSQITDIREPILYWKQMVKK
ncbi:hypothetical protein [Bacillus haynesii]|uniref:hypothetical protein n=1 Tax=Bacillus haynesii TaxID=1925021 RepID=UPI00227E1B77|nr:hypothetical protein [Bacillus haynesii]MEC1451088.1 hypothetical protein [Bacillus haynesii]